MPHPKVESSSKHPPPHDTRTRAEQMRARGSEVRMPTVTVGQYLLDYLWEVGPTGQDRAVLTWGELGAWQTALGVRLSPWELRTLRALSLDYVVQLYASDKADCPAPYGVKKKINREAIAKQIASSLDALL